MRFLTETWQKNSFRNDGKYYATQNCTSYPPKCTSGPHFKAFFVSTTFSNPSVSFLEQSETLEDRQERICQLKMHTPLFDIITLNVQYPMYFYSGPPKIASFIRCSLPYYVIVIKECYGFLRFIAES